MKQIPILAIFPDLSLELLYEGGFSKFLDRNLVSKMV